MSHALDALKRQQREGIRASLARGQHQHDLRERGCEMWKYVARDFGARLDNLGPNPSVADRRRMHALWVAEMLDFDEWLPREEGFNEADEARHDAYHDGDIDDERAEFYYNYRCWRRAMFELGHALKLRLDALDSGEAPSKAPATIREALRKADTGLSGREHEPGNVILDADDDDLYPIFARVYDRFFENWPAVHETKGLLKSVRGAISRATRSVREAFA